MKAKDKASDKTYDRLKEFGGSKYSGMKVGAGHKWYYEQGEWKERKVKPEEWEIYYEKKKNRAGKAPVGSGAPVGTAYNWLIVAHQRWTSWRQMPTIPVWRGKILKSPT